MVSLGYRVDAVQRWLRPTLVLLVLVGFYLALPDIDSRQAVPANLLQERLLRSVNSIHGEWLLQGKPQEVRWQNPEQLVLLVATKRGWPTAKPNCQSLWRQMMGITVAPMLLDSLWVDDHCYFHTDNDAEILYYPDTGSVILLQ